MRARREAAEAFVAALGAALLLLWSVGERWASARGTTVHGYLVVSKHVSGRSAAPLVAAAGVLALAGAAAIPATKRVGRLVAGVVLIIGGVAATAESVLRRSTAQDAARRALPAGSVVQVHGSAWPWVALVGGVLLTVVGIVLAVRGPRWAGLSSRYDAPAGRREDATAGDAGTWDALDRGEDPTSDPAVIRSTPAAPPEPAPPTVPSPGRPPQR